MSVSEICSSSGQGFGRGFECSTCDLRTSVALTDAEARYLAATHDRLHHGGVVTAEVTERRRCESCLSREAVTSWSNPAAGAPFALCQPCAALVPGTGNASAVGRHVLAVRHLTQS